MLFLAAMVLHHSCGGVDAARTTRVSCLLLVTEEVGGKVEEEARKSRSRWLLRLAGGVNIKDTKRTKQ